MIVRWANIMGHRGHFHAVGVVTASHCLTILCKGAEWSARVSPSLLPLVVDAEVL